MISRINYLSSKITEAKKMTKVLIIDRERYKESIRIINEEILESYKNCINQNRLINLILWVKKYELHKGNKFSI